MRILLHKKHFSCLPFLRNPHATAVDRSSVLITNCFHIINKVCVTLIGSVPWRASLPNLGQPRGGFGAENNLFDMSLALDCMLMSYIKSRAHWQSGPIARYPREINVVNLFGIEELLGELEPDLLAHEDVEKLRVDVAV
jgi:hypothetical protein